MKIDVTLTKEEDLGKLDIEFELKEGEIEFKEKDSHFPWYDIIMAGNINPYGITIKNPETGQVYRLRAEDNTVEHWKQMNREWLDRRKDGKKK